MTTYTQQRSNPIPTLFIFAIISLVALALFSVSYPTVVNGRSHAEEKHGQEVDVKKCRDMFNNGGTFSLWRNDGRKFCIQLGEEVKNGGKDMMERTKRWVIRVVDNVTGEEITLYPLCGALRCVENSLMNQGYYPISP